MPQSYSCVWLHFIWATKYRAPLIKREKKFQVYNLIKEIAEKNKIHLDFINGVEDHVHLIISMKTSQCPSDIAKIIKGVSYTEINNAKIFEEHFHWQDGFAVFSISPQNIQMVRNYIRNQEQHHVKKSLDEELVFFEKSADKFVNEVD